MGSLTMRRTNILWLDDDLTSRSEQRRGYLQVWLRWLDADNRGAEYNIIEARTLQEFARHLIDRHQYVVRDDDYLDAIIIDVKLTHDFERDFSELGFPSIKLFGLDAGAQLLGLMKNPTRFPKQPQWLHPYRRRRMALFTSASNYHSVWNRYVESEGRTTSMVILKEIYRSSDKSIQVPTVEFQDWLVGIRKDMHDGLTGQPLTVASTGAPIP